MTEQTKVTTLEQVVIRFSGDSGDGMQLTGTIFSNLSAIFGNEISTFPDYPAEVRAPQGTLSGVGGHESGGLESKRKELEAKCDCPDRYRLFQEE